ncbi:uncharacterized protein FA14DRAFT_4611 [Meira miltonrushii]|uniref:DUF788-domain-containing protein n=1 Tax=Meira miltonrushii TaxID=1280837 RepID=A0A316VG51_9BASI|nr:uncharacterized protein FA14DRAFT_4611 [Meira miltonrushii]PWN36607.1 hypothetical protein FA14DRAFT_4611 [Meira miltonrushii]
MARAASKKQAAQNAMMVRILTYGFLITNTLHLFFIFGPFRNKAKSLFWPIIKYAITELIAGALGLTLRSMASQGDDLGQHGLTAYMFDIIYVTWFTHVTTALISAKFWYTYLVIPLYAAYFGYNKLIVPFVLGGRDPIRSVISMVTGSAGQPQSAQANQTPADQQPAQSKRQAKLQKRADRGDPRIQMRQQRQ